MGKSVSDLIGTDVKVLADGSVTGTLKYVADYTDFSSNVSEQSGHYFPVRLTQSGSTMTLKKNGAVLPGKENLPFDPEIILRVESKATTFTIEVDGSDVVTLNFRSATLA